MDAKPLQLYLTAEHECGYLPNQRTATLVPDPQVSMSMPLYNQLLQHGYRRSGSHVYRPHCKSCSACIACRLPVARFKPNRNQRRCLKNNHDLTIESVAAKYTDEYFELYRRYLNKRHHDGGMVDPAPEDYEQFLYSDWSETLFIEVRKNGQLIAVAVTDISSNGLSAVYTFFAPEEHRRSLGTYCILLQIQQATIMKLDYLYMGYWIDNCQKMSYKTNFQPMEYFIDERWTDEHRTDKHQQEKTE